MSRRPALTTALAYLVIAFAMTWPLARHMTSRLPADLGDPAFNCWILMWTGGQLLQALSGHVGALADYWNGNIFHPAPLTIAYSEHLTAETLQALPLYAATGNILLAYNAVFLSTFVLAGLGMFLLVREWTGQPLAAFLAGLAYAYAPYRLGQLPHLQVLSTHWMPFVLYGLRRYFETRRLPALAGAGGALIAQGLSCGYYLLFFPPFAAAYALYEMAARRLFRDRRVWFSLAALSLIVAAACWPFAAPYLRLREIAPLGVRPASEIAEFSADTHAFATAPAASRLWASRLSNVDPVEGEGFPGLTILAFAFVGLAWAIRRRVTSVDWRRVSIEWRLFAAALAVVVIVASAVVIWLFMAGQMTLRFSGATTFVRSVDTPLRIAAGGWTLLIVLSTLLGRRGADRPPDAAGFSTIALIAAALLALGPRIEATGHPLGAGPYAWLLEYVPGFDGLRVPARFLMIVALFMAALGGSGAAWWLRVSRDRSIRLGAAVVVVGMTGVLAESFLAPIAMNQPLASHSLRPVMSLPVGRRLPPVYRLLRDSPDPIVLLELPIGDPGRDIAAVFYAGVHRRPLVNGYSGFWPPRYFRRADLFMRAFEDPPEVLSMLNEDGVTHVLIHEDAFTDERGKRLTSWLRTSGTRLVLEDGGDKLFRLR